MTALMLIVSSLFCVAQNNIAVLLSVDKESYLIRKKDKIQVTVPMFFLTGDKVEVKSGKVVILMGDGSEKILRKGDKYIFRSKNRSRTTVESEYVFSKISSENHVDNMQTTSAYSLRSNNLLSVFPLSSKVFDRESSYIFWNKNFESMNFRVYNLDSDSLVLEKKIAGESLCLNSLPVDSPGVYYWVLSDDSKDVEKIGVITFVDDAEKRKLKSYNDKSRLGLLSAYVHYSENEYWFQAINIIDEAIKLYPDDELFTHIRSSITKM